MLQVGEGEWLTWMVFGACSGKASPGEAWEEVATGSGAAKSMPSRPSGSFALVEGGAPKAADSSSLLGVLCQETGAGTVGDVCRHCFKAPWRCRSYCWGTGNGFCPHQLRILCWGRISQGYWWVCVLEVRYCEGEWGVAMEASGGCSIVHPELRLRRSSAWVEGRPCVLHYLGPHPSWMDLWRIHLHWPHSKVVTPCS